MSDVENVSSDVTQDVDITQAGEEAGEHEKLPLHLHERGKELVAQKNAALAETKRWKALGDSPEIIAEKLRRLEMWEAAEEVEETKPVAKTYTETDFNEQAKQQYARQVIEQIAPEIKEIKALKEKSTQQERVLASFSAAIEDIAWDTTVEIAEELDMEPEALAELVKPVLRSEKKLLRQFSAGRSDIAVKEAVKILQKKIAKQVAKEDSGISTRAEQIKKASETQNKVPKTHAPGKTEVTVKQDDSPKDFKEAEKRLMARLDKQGL